MFVCFSGCKTNQRTVRYPELPVRLHLFFIVGEWEIRCVGILLPEHVSCTVRLFLVYLKRFRL